MKIDLTAIDTSQFMVHPHIINGNTVYLVQPQHIGCKWTQQNKHFRSSLWDSDGNLISAGMPKFVNWGENPDNFPVPTSLKDTNIVEKLDGSLLIVTKWKGQFILRTRGTVDATKLDNGYELEIFKETILSKIIGSAHDLSCGDTWDFSLLFEWVSPIQRIILSYGDQPEWYLVGYVDHEDYQLLRQSAINELANDMGWKRPPSYTFPSIEDLMSNVEQWKGKEGVVVYSNHDQTLHKLKALEYLTKHRFKSEATLENTLDLYFSMGKPSYQEFEKKLIEAFDYECFEMVRGFISTICDAHKNVQQIVDGFDYFIENTLKPLPTRKDQAQRVLASYGTTNRASFIFAKLDGRTLSDDQMKKLFWQVLKK